MADKLTAIRLKQGDGYGPQIPIKADAENITYKKHYNIEEILGNVDIEKGDLQKQINDVNNTIVDTTQEWLDEHYISPTVSFEVYDPTKAYQQNDYVIYKENDNQNLYICISNTPQPAGDWDSTKWQLIDLTIQIPIAVEVPIDDTLSLSDYAADAKATGDLIKINQAAVNTTKLVFNTSDDVVSIPTMDDINNFKDNINDEIENINNQLEDINNQLTIMQDDIETSTATLSSNFYKEINNEKNRAITIESLKINKPETSPNGQAGQLLRTNGDGTTQWADEGTPSDEQVQTVITEWMNQHSGQYIVPDNSLDENQFKDILKLKTINQYYTPEMFGAVGDNSTDDSAAIQNMIDSVPNNAVCIMTKNYYCGTGLEVKKPVNIYMYGACTFNNELEYGFRVYHNYSQKNTFRLNLKAQGPVNNNWQHINENPEGLNLEDPGVEQILENAHKVGIVGLDLRCGQENTYDVYCENFYVGIRLACGGLDIVPNTTNNENADCDYNKIFIRKIYNCKQAILMDEIPGTPSSLSCTVSQNVFIGGRIGVQGRSYTWLRGQDTTDCVWDVRSTGKHANSCNSFLGVSFEAFGNREDSAHPQYDYSNRAKMTLDFKNCMYLNCRFEGITWIGNQFPNNNGWDPSMIIGGYDVNKAFDKTSNATVIASNIVRIAGYSQPVVINNTKSTNTTYLTIENADNNTISAFKEDKFYLPKVALLPNGNTYKQAVQQSQNSMNLVFAYKSENQNDDPNKVISNSGNNEFRFTEIGHIISKDNVGTAYDIQPITTTVPSFETIPTGMMIFNNNRPQWWDGQKWVYADGTSVSNS